MKLLIFLSLIAVAFSKNCCLPKQYEAIADTMIGTGPGPEMPASLNKMTGKLSCDYTKRMLNYNLTGEYNGHKYVFRSLQDYNTNVMYNIDEHGNCKKLDVPTPGMLDTNCLDKMNHVRDGYIGSPKNKMAVHIYELGSDTITVDDDCVMIDSVRTFGNSMQASRITDLIPAIADPSVFDVPSSCKHLNNL